MWSVEEEEQSSGPESHSSTAAESSEQERPRSRAIGLMEMKRLIRATLMQITKVKLPGLSQLQITESTIVLSLEASPHEVNMHPPQPQPRSRPRGRPRRWPGPRPQHRPQLRRGGLPVAEEDLLSHSETQDTEYMDLYVREEDFASSYTCSSLSHPFFIPCHPLVSRRPAQYFGEGPINPQALPCIDPLPSSEIDVKINKLVRYFLHKYVKKQPATMAEMLTGVLGKYQGYYHTIFSQASECMLLVFGIEVKEVPRLGQTYAVVPALGLTYDRRLSGTQGMPKTGLLILVLCVVFLECNSAREEVVWSVLDSMGVFGERYHLMFGHPRKLITEDFVQEGYLECQQVPHTYPERYEFLWGARAYAEIGQIKILKFLSDISGCNPTSHATEHAEGLRGEADRAQPELPQQGTALPCTEHQHLVGTPVAPSEEAVRQMREAGSTGTTV